MYPFSHYRSALTMAYTVSARHHLKRNCRTVGHHPRGSHLLDQSGWKWFCPRHGLQWACRCFGHDHLPLPWDIYQLANIHAQQRHCERDHHCSYHFERHGSPGRHLLSSIHNLMYRYFYQRIDTQPSPLLVTTGDVIPVVLLAHWTSCAAIFGACLLCWADAARVVWRHPKTIHMLSLGWLWSRNEDLVRQGSWRQSQLTTWSLCILTSVLVASLALVVWLTSDAVAAASKHNSYQSGLLCIIVSLASRATFMYKLLRGQPLWSARFGYDGFTSFTPFPGGQYFSPHASTFLLFTLAYPISHLVLRTQGCSWVFYMPRLDAWRLLAVIVAFTNAVYAMLRLEMKNVALDVIL